MDHRGGTPDCFSHAVFRGVFLKNIDPLVQFPNVFISLQIIIFTIVNGAVKLTDDSDSKQPLENVITSRLRQRSDCQGNVLWTAMLFKQNGDGWV